MMDGTLDLQISSETVPDLATANTDFLRGVKYINKILITFIH